VGEDGVAAVETGRTKYRILFFRAQGKNLNALKTETSLY